MNSLDEHMAALNINSEISNEIPEYLKSPIIREIFEDGMDIYKPEDKWVILGVPNVYCSKYFDDEDFIYAKMKFSQPLEEDLDLNLDTYLQIHKLTISSLDLSLNPNTIFAKILYLYQYSNSYYTSLRHLRPLERTTRMPNNYLQMINNTLTIIRYLLDNNLFNYQPNELIPEEMFNELRYGLNLIICHARLMCNHYCKQNELNNSEVNVGNGNNGDNGVKNMEEKHLKKLMRLVNNMCVIMIYFKIAF